MNKAKKIAVVGAGPAGLSAATVAAERGHRVTLFEAAVEIGGQFNIAMAIPGKEDFAETLRYYRTMLAKHNVEVALDQQVTADDLRAGQFDHIIVATGVKPRKVDIPGHDHSMVLRYDEVVREQKPVGKRVAIIGAGGIGFDLAEYLLGPEPEEDEQHLAHWYREWGIDQSYSTPGSLIEPEVAEPLRQITLLQRKPAPLGKGLGKTSGWVHRLQMKKHQVQMIGSVQYRLIDENGLHISVDGEEQLLEVDNVVICAGQLSVNALYQELNPYGKSKHVHLIGGAYIAAEVDAKRAIREGSELAARL